MKNERFIAAVKRSLRAGKIRNGVAKKVMVGPFKIEYRYSNMLKCNVPLRTTKRYLVKNADKVKIQHYEQRELFDNDRKIEYITEKYRRMLGKEIHFSDPHSLTEKINWLKLYYKDPAVTQCCDKYAVKQYAENKLGKPVTATILSVWENSDQIDLSGLPESFVIKVNWSSGYNIFVEKKSDLTKRDIDLIKQQTAIWTEEYSNSYYDSFNWGYKDIRPVIYAEEMLPPEFTENEYKIFCFNGEPYFTLIEKEPWGTDPERVCVDNLGQRLPFIFGSHRIADEYYLPEEFTQMIETARILAGDFPFVRIDFMEADRRYILSEMTFYSGGGFSKISPDGWDEKLGEKIILYKSTEKHVQINNLEMKGN